jgi:hypothetical protein
MIQGKPDHRPVCVISIAHLAVKDLVLNWISSLAHLNITKFVVFSHDTQLVELLSSLGYASKSVLISRDWFAGTEIDPDSSNWAQLVWLNQNLIDHIQYLTGKSGARMAFNQENSIDRLRFNTGIFYAEPSRSTRLLFSLMLAEQQKDPALYVDNTALNHILQDYREGLNRRDVIGLEPFLYPSGSDFFHERMGSEPFAVHVNFVSLDHCEKVKLMQAQYLVPGE